MLFLYIHYSLYIAISKLVLEKKLFTHSNFFVLVFIVFLKKIFECKL